jgi:hypothetical protein
VPVGVTGHRAQRPRGQVGPPGPHPAQPSSSLDPGGERRPIPPPLAPLIAQLVPWRHPLSPHHRPMPQFSLQRHATSSPQELNPQMEGIASTSPTASRLGRSSRRSRTGYCFFLFDNPSHQSKLQHCVALSTCAEELRANPAPVHGPIASWTGDRRGGGVQPVAVRLGEMSHQWRAQLEKRSCACPLGNLLGVGHGRDLAVRLGQRRNFF